MIYYICLMSEEIKQRVWETNSSAPSVTTPYNLITVVNGNAHKLP